MALPYESYNIDDIGAKFIPELEDVEISNLADTEVLAYNESTQKWENTIIIPGSETLDGLTDTSITNLQNNQFLVYNSTSGKWENNNVTDIDTLDNLSDTNITSLTNKDLLVYDSANSIWINSTIGIDDLNDVNITSLGNTEILKYNGTQWVNTTVLINELQDVNITNLQNNEVLKYNSSSGNWENQDNTDSISELQDTNITSLANNNILKYNSTSSKWLNTFINFDELQDVNLHTLTNGAILKYNSTNSEWETSSLSLNELNNVNTTGVADTNVLKYDSTTSQFLTGAVLLNEVFDVTITNPLNNQFLVYNSTSSKWENNNVIDIDTLDNLSDTNITSLTNKDLLVYDSATSRWINSTIGIDDLNDVNTSGVQNTNVLKYNGTSFVPGQVSINEIPEINITTPGNTEVLKYNNGSWVNEPVNVNEINGIDLTLLVNNELLRKDGANNSVVGADIITSTTTGAGVSIQKTTFVDAIGFLYAPLSSIESKVDGGVYSMTLNPNDANPNQTGKFVLVSNNNNTRVGINVANPTEDFEIDGNIQLDSNHQSRIIFYDTQNDHEHAEIDAEGVGTNGGQLKFYTKVDGGSVTEKMRITHDGAVGINTSSPNVNSKLDVDGNIKVNDKIFGSNQQLELYTNTTSTNSYGFIEMSSSKSTFGGTNLEFYVNSNTTSNGNRMINAETTGVAINKGSGAPSHTLEVNGDIKGDNLFLGANGETPKIDMFFIDSANGPVWDTKIEIGKSDDITNSPAFPPNNAYGMNVQANSDGLFVGVETYDGGSNWRPLLKWGDDSTDTPFRILSHSGNHSYEFGTDGNYKISGNEFRVNDILHIRYTNSAYEIQPNLGNSGSFNSAARLVLNQYNASLRVLNSSYAEITSISPYKDGTIYHRGNFYNVSDDRLKSYETDVSNATSLVIKMNPKFYIKHPTLITDDPEPDLSDVLHFNEYGFIAQELNEDPQLSHFVKENPNDNIYHVNYVEMIPLLVQTIKELNERIRVLENAS